MASLHGQSNTDQNTRKNKSRKRTRNIERHKIYQQKQKVQRGLEHTTKSGNVVKAKEFCVQNSCGCKKKCAKNIDADRQRELHTTFYSLEKKTLVKENIVFTITDQKTPYKRKFEPGNNKTKSAL